MTEPDVIKVGHRGHKLRWAARIIGVAALAFFTYDLLGISYAYYTEDYYLIIPMVFLLAAYILTWWKERLGGILLLAGYLLLSISPSVLSLFFHGDSFSFYFPMFFLAVPFLISGVFFILASAKN